MANTFKDDYAEFLWKRNVKHINSMIRGPLALGIFISSLLFYLNFDQIRNDFKKSKNPFEFQIKKNFKTPSKWIKSNFSNIKVNKMIFIPGIFGYLVSFGGAVYLSLNAGLKKDKEIKIALAQNKYVNADGEPWDLVWTPLGILFYGYNCDPALVQKNTRFWNSINFTPDDPKQSPKDANVFYIKKAYDLPKLITLNFAPIINLEKQEQKAKMIDTNPDPNIAEIDLKTLDIEESEVINDYAIETEDDIIEAERKMNETIAENEASKVEETGKNRTDAQTLDDKFASLSDKPILSTTEESKKVLGKIAIPRAGAFSGINSLGESKITVIPISDEEIGHLDFFIEKPAPPNQDQGEK